MSDIQGTVVATSVSTKKGTRKQPRDVVSLKVGTGIEGDAHSGSWHRQVSLLPDESVDRMRATGFELNAGDFAENILTRGIALYELPVGTLLQVGDAVVAVTQIGKTCHNDCEIRRTVGMCVMPTDGIFGVVVRDGDVRPGDTVSVIEM